MSEQSFERLYAKPVPIDICHPCTALWFDRLENLTLTPGAVLRLFVVMNDNKPAQRTPLRADLICPRCHARLRLTHDMQRNTRFQYWSCPDEHGHFITFFEFLREKNFVRPLGPAELARLKDNVRTVTCSSCGAPVDLDVDAACPYCRAPLSMLDAGQLDAVVQQLKRDEAKRQAAAGQPLDPALARRLAEVRSDAPDEGDGLVEAGLAALSAFLKL
jgi:Zn-finger nucleic acid-binding protein